MIPSDIIKKVKQIQIMTRRTVNDVIAGQYHSVFKGQGIEFDEVREYQPGDDVRMIDWNVTARTGHPHIKKFVEERERTVMLMVDASASGLFGSQRQRKREYAAELGAILAFSAINNRDKVGLLIFTDTVEKFIPPKKGKSHVLRVIRDILYFEAKGRKTSISHALTYLGSVLKRKSVCFLISDFLDDHYKKDLEIMNRYHDMIALTITDPRECDLPPVGMVQLEDLETGAQMLLDTKEPRVAKDYAERMRQRMTENKKLLHSISVDNIDFMTDQPTIEPLRKFFRMREKRR